VAQATDRADLADGGFETSWIVSGLSPGPHTIYVYALVYGVPLVQTVQIQVAG